jgi:hypothetical protein
MKFKIFTGTSEQVEREIERFFSEGENKSISSVSVGGSDKNNVIVGILYHRSSYSSIY